MGQLSITHTPAQGTRLSGSEKGDGAAEVLTPAGWRWMSGIGWYVPGTRDHTPRLPLIEATAERLRAAGFTVDVELDHSARPTVDREVDYQARAATRADRLDRTSEVLHARSEAAERRAEQLAELWPIGQPILVDHHGAARTTRFLDRLSRARNESAELEHDARLAGERAQSTRAAAAARTAPRAVIERIERLEAKERKLKRQLEAGERPTRSRTLPLSEADRERTVRDLENTREEIEHWRGVNAQQVADGLLAGITQADVRNGDEVLFRGDWLKVVLVNKKTVTVLSSRGNRGKLAYHQLDGRRAATNATGGEAGA